jgi:hypothetical protein
MLKLSRPDALRILHSVAELQKPMDAGDVYRSLNSWGISPHLAFQRPARRFGGSREGSGLRRNGRAEWDRKLPETLNCRTHQGCCNVGW